MEAETNNCEKFQSDPLDSLEGVIGQTDTRTATRTDSLNVYDTKNIKEPRVIGWCLKSRIDTGFFKVVVITFTGVFLASILKMLPV